jgi:hypothetical protein
MLASAIVKLGRDHNGILYVEADLQRRPTPQLIADSVEMIRLFNPTALLWKPISSKSSWRPSSGDWARNNESICRFTESTI